MSRTDQEFAVLVEGVNSIEAGMARSLLEEAGIPCLLHGPDFDIAELGTAAHDMLRGTNVLVPHSALEQARKLLSEAWGEGADRPGVGD